jgi:uncharacterized protein (TIGR03083 family)
VDFRAALLDQTRDFGELIRSADPSTPVPTCPDWTLTQLFRHVGRGNRWAAQIIADRRTERLDLRDVRDGKPPDDPDAAIDWLNNGAQLVIDAVDSVGPETRVWTFLSARPCGWWIRRRLHEATVHRADAAFALGLDYKLSPELAADGISEWIERVSVQSRSQPPPLELGRTLHLHATDDGLGPAGEWFVRGAGERIAWEHGHAKGDVAVRGPVADLLLALLRRRPSDTVETIGDAAVWERWLAKTGF